MSKIRGEDTKIEIQVRHWLYHHGIRYRKNYDKIAGKPDIALTKYGIAIFIHGCFWHGHENCKLFRLPKTRVEFWRDKINKNKVRDQKNHEDSMKAGWWVFIIWECQIKTDFDGTMKTLFDNILTLKNHHKD